MGGIPVHIGAMMKEAMALALSLSRVQDDAALLEWGVTHLAHYWQPALALVGVLTPCRQHLQCRAVQAGQARSLRLSATDFTHPFTYVLHRAQPRVWQTLHGGARIEHADVNALVSGMAPDTGMLALPVMAGPGVAAVGVLVVFGPPAQLMSWQTEGGLQDVSELLARRWGQIMSVPGAPLAAVDQPAVRAAPRSQVSRATERVRLMGASAAMQAVRQEVENVARHRLSVLILGETGTGKEVVAKAIHQSSAQAAHPFVAINCAAIPENLIESELFGYEKGAFSGATSAKVGLMVQAHGGTLFLDEVGDMPAAMQAKLLRVLETRQVRPLGAQREVACDFRLLAATHQPLTRAVSDGRFREDLFHRLAQCVIRLPPLRERAADIPLLCAHFHAQSLRDHAFEVGPLAPDLVAQLTRYALPGNVRELKNLIEVACAHTLAGKPVSLASLPGEQRARVCADVQEQDPALDRIVDLRAALKQYEASIIVARLARFGGNQQQAADSLNVPRRTLHYRCKQLALEVPPKG